MYPIYASLLAYGIFFIAGSQLSNKPLLIHGTIAVLTSVMLVFTNEHAGRYPWSVYCVLSLALALTIHLLVAFRGTDRQELFFELHASIFSFIQCTLLFAWAYAFTRFPWFLIPFFVLGAALVLHWLILRQRKRRQMAADNAPVAPTVDVPNNQTFTNNMTGTVEPQFSIQPFQAQQPQQPYTYQQPQQMYVPQVYPQPIMSDIPVQQPTVQMYPPVQHGN
jgi:hypothetical protein